jgi:hypothetical protein
MVIILTNILSVRSVVNWIAFKAPLRRPRVARFTVGRARPARPRPSLTLYVQGCPIPTQGRSSADPSSLSDLR